MGCFVRGGKNGMGYYVRDDKKTAWDVLSGVPKNGMGCFVGLRCGLHFRGLNLGIQIVVIVSSNTQGKSLVRI